MEKRGKSLAEKIEECIPIRTTGKEGKSYKELAKEVGVARTNVYRALTKLSAQGKVVGKKERRGVNKATTIYFKVPSKEARNSSRKKKEREQEEQKDQQAKSLQAAFVLETTSKQQKERGTRKKERGKKKRKRICATCQRYSGIGRCILLDLVVQYTSWQFLEKELRARFFCEALEGKTPACDYYDPRENGHCKSKPLSKIIQKNSTRNPWIVQCPIERCKQPIEKFSQALKMVKLGGVTYYCPHCGSPMIYKYNKALNRYEVKYWDARFDLLQRDFKQLTGLELPARKEAKNFGVSIAKEASYKLDLKQEEIYLGNLLITEGDVEGLDYFPLKELTFITTNDWSDYRELKEKLHQELTTGRLLYEQITIFPPQEPIESVEPTEKERGGNEILIATEVPFVQAFQANIGTQKAVIEAAGEVEAYSKEIFAKARKKLQRELEKYQAITKLSYRPWQQYEGGCASIMYEPFKEEAKKYGFSATARTKARMVKGEPFLPFGKYYARTNYDTLINGVNKEVIRELKKKVYNEIGLAWKGLRGWCHRKYQEGLAYDSYEQAKKVVLLCANRAIREERITTNHFTEKRGKRYEPFFCVLPESEGEQIIKEIAREVLRITIRWGEEEKEGEHTEGLRKGYERFLKNQKELLNGVAQYSAQIPVKEKGEKKKSGGKIVAPWKKMQRIEKIDPAITKEEERALQKIVRKFFEEEFTFKPLAIKEIL